MRTVAGDFYADFLNTTDKQTGLLIADVSGHGIPAALIASMVKLAASSQRAAADNPAGLLANMNAILCGNRQKPLRHRRLRFSRCRTPRISLCRRSPSAHAAPPWQRSQTD